MAEVPMYRWEGVFRKGPQIWTGVLTFMGCTMEVMHTSIENYVIDMENKGWTLSENKLAKIN